MKNITKWLGASVVFGLLSLATQRADAILEMSYTNNSPSLLGTVNPGLQGNGGQAARDVAMTNTLLGMGFHTQARIPFPNGPLYSRTTWPGDGPATITGAVLANGFGDGTTPISSTCHKREPLITWSSRTMVQTAVWRCLISQV